MSAETPRYAAVVRMRDEYVVAGVEFPGLETPGFRLLAQSVDLRVGPDGVPEGTAACVVMPPDLGRRRTFHDGAPDEPGRLAAAARAALVGAKVAVGEEDRVVTAAVPIVAAIVPASPLPADRNSFEAVWAHVLSQHYVVRTAAEGTANSIKSECRLAWDLSRAVNANAVSSALAQAVTKLATAVIDREGAFGMTLGGIDWDAGECKGDEAHPKGRGGRDLSADELAAVIAHVAAYIANRKEASDV